MKAARRVFYEGRVQGVGFRATTRWIAGGFEVTGYVRNLADGRVELFAQGAATEVGEFLKAIRESELSGHIKSAVEEPAGIELARKGFAIG